MNQRPTTIRLAIRAFREVVSSSPVRGIAYPLVKNVSSLIEVAEIFMMGTLVGSIATLLENSELFSWDVFKTSDTFRYFFIIIILFFLRTIASFALDYLDSSLSDMFWKLFQRRCIDKMATLNLEDIEQRDIQTLISSVPSFSWSSLWDAYKQITDLGYHLVLFCSSSYIIASRMSLLGLLVIVLVIPEAMIRYHYNVKVKNLRDSESERYKYKEYLFNQALILRNFAEMRVDNVFTFFSKAYEATASAYYTKLNRIRLLQSIFGLLGSWLDGSFRRVIQIILIPIALIKHYTIGTFKYLFDYIDKLYDSSWNLLWQSLQIKTNTLYIKDYFDFMDYSGFGDITSGTETLNKLTAPRVEFVNVGFSYPDSPSSALQDISLVIKPGEKIAIIGRDNSGKSTIAKLLCGLYQIGPGDILIDNISIKNLGRGELKNKVAVVFEDFVKYNFSIRKNITITQPDRDFSKRLYEEALEITGLDVWMHNDGINDHTILGKMFGKGISVSTGHWQRIAIARAVYHDRSILVLDESLTQIDSFSRRPILEKIIEHRPNQTFVHITQDESENDLFDTLVYIEKGKITKIDKKKNQ